MTEYPDFHGDMPITHSQLKESKNSCACDKKCNCDKNCDCTKCGCKECVPCPCGGNCTCSK